MTTKATPAQRRAYELGESDGRNARLFAEPGIPVEPDLSGEWADGRTPASLAAECDIDYDVEVEDDLCDAYEDGFYAAQEGGE